MAANTTGKWSDRMTTERLPLRSEVDSQFTWRLEDIYADDAAWERELEDLYNDLEAFASYRDQLDQGDTVLQCLLDLESLGMAMERLFAYAQMRKDEDNTNDTYQGFADRAMRAYVQMEQTTAFVQPEILTHSQETVAQWLDAQPELGVFQHYLEDIMRQKPHTLPADQEELLAGASEMAQAPSQVFGMFNDADLTFPDITNENGQSVQLTHGRYIQFLESPKRSVREEAFKTMHGTFAQWKNTLAATYTAAVKQSVFYARARNYPSSRAMSLDANNIPETVYDNLVDTVHEHLPSFYRYTRLRRQLLKLDSLHMWDLHVPMVEDVEMKIPHDQAVDMVRDGLRALGPTYLKDLEDGMKGGWIDWFENKGKTSGAYSWGAYGIHPFVLMNYQENVDNMFTLAHEMGHAMHSFYSHRQQRYINAGYSIFVAEVASTVNECLVMNHMLKTTQDPAQRMYLLNHYLNQFRGTVFRQTMFAEFERDVHRAVEEGQSMTAESLGRRYQELNGIYHGPDVHNDDEIAAEWSRIPHFYRPFYVYQYATGFSAAVALSQAILQEGEPAVQRYLEFLGSGGSDYPIAVLAKAGVDMRSPEPIHQGLQVFAQLLDEMEAIQQR